MATGAVFYILILVGTLVFSFMAFQPGNGHLMEKYKFNVGAILHQREWYRIVTSGFLHADFNHLFGNMITLAFIGETMELGFGKFGFLALYFGSKIGGSLLALLLHRNDPQYSSIGASGAIFGLLFAFCILAPDALIYLFFILPIPAWLLAIGYTAYSLFGIRTRHANIGHEAHLGGGIIGIFAACIHTPAVITAHWYLVFGLLIPSVFILYLFYKDPNWIMHPGEIFKRQNFQQQRRGPRKVYVREVRSGRRERPQTKEKGIEISTRAELEAELNDLLELISRKGGVDKLSKKERSRLEELRDMLYGGPSGPGHRAPGG